MRRLLVDTGPLVAWFDADDTHHEAVKRYLDSYDGELLSTWPVLTETCHLLPESIVPGFMQWVATGGLTIADLPMDLADASLIRLAENLGVLDVLTLDRRDFGIYRTARGKALRNVLDTAHAVRRRPGSR